MMGKQQLNNRRYFTKEYLKIVITEDLVGPIYSESSKHPKWKYRLTDKGKGLMQQ
jgi:ATP-dependent DNA helicase recG